MNLYLKINERNGRMQVAEIDYNLYTNFFYQIEHKVSESIFIFYDVAQHNMHSANFEKV